MSGADLLSLARALAVVPVAWLIGVDARAPALAVFAAAALTDLGDGALARRAGPTRHGALIDPLADKVFVVGIALALFAAGLGRREVLPPALLAALGAREVAMALVRLAEHRAGSWRPADAGGKVKTALQMCALGVLIAVRPPEPLGVAAVWLLGLATLLGFVRFAPSIGRRGQRPL